ncbi:MAG: hypothetical protein ACOCRK_05610 [bacterium]
MGKRILLTGLGNTPKPIIYAIKQGDILGEEFEPLRFYDKIYIFCSEYQRNKIAERVGYEKSNEEVIRDFVNKSEGDVDLHFIDCDVFSPLNVYYNVETIITPEINKRNEVVVNYSAGSAIVRNVLGIMGMYCKEKYDNIYTVYTISYKEDIKVARDHSEQYSNLVELLSNIDGLLERGKLS